MSDPERLDPAAARARDQVRGLASPAPEPAFRARLGEAFVRGTIRSSAPPPRLRIAPDALRWGAVAAAAALVAAIVFTARAPRWELTSLAGTGVAVVDGLPVPLTSVESLARHLKPGARVRIPDGASVEIASAGLMAMELTPGTDVTIPRLPSAPWTSRTSAELRSGEVRITTGARFAGARLSLTTPEAAIEVTGTTLAVICDPEGTCVCVYEGRVRVGPRAGAMADVGRGTLRFVFNDARPPKVAPMRETERMKLGEFAGRKRSAMGR